MIPVSAALLCLKQLKMIFYTFSEFITPFVTFVMVFRRFIRIDNELPEHVTKEEIVAEVCYIFHSVAEFYLC